MKVEQVFVCLAFIALVSLIACTGSPVMDEENSQDTRIELNLSGIPNAVTKIVADLSRPGFATIHREATVTGQQASLSFNSVKEGTWHLRVEAKDNSDIVLFAGETDIDVIARQTVDVTLSLNPVDGDEGNIRVLVTWGDAVQTFIYDFNGGSLSGWHGPANAEISDNALHLWSETGYKWRTISSISDNHFTKGKIEFDIQPLDGAYVFETKGASASNGVLNWGVYLRWRDNFVYAHTHENGEAQLNNTGVSYQEEHWYHVTITFDSFQGPKGRYSVWVKDISTGSPEVFAGEYDYYAQYGALVGANQISLGVHDPQTPRTIVKHVFFDNFEFEVSR